MNQDMRDTASSAVSNISGAKHMGSSMAGQFAIAYAIFYGLKLVAMAIYAPRR